MATQQKQGKPEQDNEPKSDQWQQDLNPNPMAGQNVGEIFEEAGRFDRTAYDIKELHTELKDYSNDELKQIPLLKPGSRLKQGAKYINLNDPARLEFTAMGDMETDSHNLFVAKSDISYQLWNRLTGVENT